MSSAIADTLRILLTLGALGGLLLIWALILPNLTPFPSHYTPSMVEAEKERASRYARLHTYSVRADIVFFVWLVVEGALLVPYLFWKYGLQ